MGATAAGIAFEPTAKAETHTGTASAETGTPPNYTPPIVQVDGATMKSFVTGALASLPVVDLKVEDAPIEEVLADVFAKGDAAT